MVALRSSGSTLASCSETLMDEAHSQTLKGLTDDACRAIFVELAAQSRNMKRKIGFLIKDAENFSATIPALLFSRRFFNDLHRYFVQLGLKTKS